MIPLQSRILASLGLIACFIVIYGSAELFTSMRANVSSIYYPWERHLPFVPAATIPYLSIDLFYVFAPLIIRNRHQMRVYCTRILVALFSAGIIFILFPLRFAFERPNTSGFLGDMMELFWRADFPVNQLPSLHVAFLLIISDVYLKKFRGRLRTFLLGWLICIGISPLLVLQHHAVDLIAGLALGLICVVLIGDDSPSPFKRNFKIGSYYLIAAILLLSTCTFLSRSSWPLWWPALSLLLLALGYFAIGPSIYGKRRGRLSIAARWLFWPTLVAQHLSLWWYSRKSTPYSRLTETVWIGRVLSEANANAVSRRGITAVIDLTAEFDAPISFRALNYLQVPILDLTAPTPDQILQTLRFLHRHEPTGITFIHCKVGYSRTAVIAAAYLLETGRANSVASAISMIKFARPGLVVRPEAHQAITEFYLSITNRSIDCLQGRESNDRDHPSIGTAVLTSEI